MARPARLKIKDAAACYHVTSRTAGAPEWLPFRDDPEAADHLRSLILFYTNAYRCRLASHEVMGNHFHAVLDFEKPRRLSKTELLEAAKKLYGRRVGARTRKWTKVDWKDFNERLFDLSALMRDLKSVFSTWYNRRHGRRGPLWDDRFKSVLLEDDEAIRTMVLYVELNAVRAGLVRLPWEWPLGSAHMRRHGDSPGLVPVAEIFPPPPGVEAHAHYQALLLYRGLGRSRDSEAVIPAWVIRRELDRGRHPGDLLKPSRALTDGMALGTRRGIAARQGLLLEKGYFRRPRKPFPCLVAGLFTARGQRSNARPR